MSNQNGTEASTPQTFSPPVAQGVQIDPGWFIIYQQNGGVWRQAGKAHCTTPNLTGGFTETWCLCTEDEAGWFRYVSPNASGNLDTRFVHTTTSGPPSASHARVVATCAPPVQVR